MNVPTFYIGIGTDTEEKHIFSFGGQGYGPSRSDLIWKYSTEFDQWSSIGTRLPALARTTTCRGLNGTTWVLITFPYLSVDLFHSDTETLAGLNVTNVPSCELSKKGI